MALPPRPPVAVVVPTRDRPEHLASLVAALAIAVGPDDEVVVVDSASTHPDALAPARAAGIRVVRCERPGASRARNAGVAATTAPIVAFTDDDCAPRPEWIDRIAGAMVDPARAFVTGRVVADRVGAVVSVLQDTEPRTFRWGDDPARMGHGANAAVRRAWLHQVGGWDEHLGAGAPLRGGEDQDLFLRILHAGGEGVYDPAVEVVHRQWRSTRQGLGVQLGYGMGTAAVIRKAWSLDRRLGRALAWRTLTREGAAAVVRQLLQGRRQAAARTTLRMVGIAAGVINILRYRVDHGFLQRRG